MEHLGLPFVYTEDDPPPSTREVVLNCWRFEVRQDTSGSSFEHHIPVDGCVSLVWTLGEGRLVLVGPRTSGIDIPVAPGHVTVGIRCWPDASAVITGCSPLALRDFVGPATLCLGDRLDVLAARLGLAGGADGVAAAFADWLVEAAAGSGAPDPMVRQAVRAIAAGRGETRVADIAASTGLGIRQLERRFKACVGLTLKQFARIRRFRSTAGLLLTSDRSTWSRRAYAQGFADHAHLVREFVALTGATPVEFEARVARNTHRGVVP